MWILCLPFQPREQLRWVWFFTFIILISAANTGTLPQFIWQTSWSNSFPNIRNKGKVNKPSNEENATQITKGRTEQQISETTNDLQPAIEQPTTKIRPRTNQLWTKAGEPRICKQVLKIFFLYSWVRASWIKINNCPTRCEYIQFIIFK